MALLRPRLRRLQVLAVLLGLTVPISAGLTSATAAPAPSRQATADSRAAARVPAQRYITAILNKKYVRKGHKVAIHGMVIAPGVPACAAAVPLNVLRSTRTASYRVVGHTTSDPVTGAYAVRAVVKRKSRFRIQAPGTEACVEVSSPPRTVKIKPPRT